jgi:hypothetical protein
VNAPQVRTPLLCLLTLGAIYHTSPWPAIQGALHVLLVLGLAPSAGSALAAGLWACAAGWVLEGSLHLYPRLGGTPLAGMAIALLAAWMRTQWPPETREGYWARLVALTALLALLTHGVVRLVAGPHVWGWGWLLAVLLVPAWGTLAYRLPSQRR